MGQSTPDIPPPLRTQGLKSEPSAPDGREFAEHLRTVHFSLVLAAFALLVGSLLTGSADASRALVDLRRLKDIEAELKLGWADVEAEKIIESRSLKLVGQDWLVGPTNSTETQPVYLYARWFITPPPSIDKEGTWRDSEKISEGGGLAWDNDPDAGSPLSEFKVFWNRLSEKINIVLIKSVSEKALTWTMDANVFPPVYPPTTFSLETVRPGEHGKIWDQGFFAGLVRPKPDFMEWIKTEPTLAAFASGLDDPKQLVMWCTKRDDSRHVLIPIDTLEINFNAQKAFQAAHGTKFHYGKFEEAFSDLDKLTKNFQDLPYDRLTAILESEASRTSDRVEMFGAKIPANALAVWGSPILILVQFYLLLHLSAFQLWLPNWPKVANVAWIGLYPSWSARFATLLSVGLLPTCVIGYLLVRHALRFTYWWESLLIAVAVSASVSIGVASGICLLRVWRNSTIR